MVSSWIRSMFSSKKKNKKPVSLLSPRLFKDLELLRLEDRITPAYDLILEGTDLVLRVSPSLDPTPTTLANVISNISLVGQTLTVTTTFTTSPAGGSWGGNRINVAGLNFTTETGVANFTFNLNQGALFGINFTNFIIQNSIPAGDSATTRVTFI